MSTGILAPETFSSSYLEGNVFGNAATRMGNSHATFGCCFRFRQDELKFCVGLYYNRRSGRHGECDCCLCCDAADFLLSDESSDSFGGGGSDKI
jgi:hypothetical protein